MAKTHGKGGSIDIGANLLGETVSWTIDENIDVADQTAQGDTAKTYLTGIADWSGSAECLFDKADTAQAAATLGSTATTHFHPEGQTTGDADWNGTALITAVSLSAPMGDVVKISYTFQGNGALTKGTHA